MTTFNETNTLAVLFASFIMLSSATTTDTIRGELFTAGTPEKRQTSISIEPDNHKLNVCPGPRFFELTQLAGTIVSLTGHIRRPSVSEDSCIHVETFEIHEIAKGRPAYIGELKMIDKNKFVILGDNGKSWTLSKIPPGLKDLLNTKIICDLVADESNGETTWLVARAFIIPSSP